MDKGAHFYKCDFQVHTPRDIQWTGNKFGVNPEELADLSDQEKEEISNVRIQFAKEYLDKVRSKGLNAIAITDHHDVTFSKCIRKVANEENEIFIASEENQKCIVVFPGIELTLSNPVCQCLLIFDADIPDQQLDTTLSMFGIIPSNEFERATVQTNRIAIEQVRDLRHLHQMLDAVPTIKGRYILLPNLNLGGTSTLLRTGAQEHYKNMPCVGGYVDKSLSTDTGWLNKLNGGDPNYGNKPLGVVSTSDNRFEDGREFGQYFTWIKWAEASAEAIRQACLAKQSRISQTEPQLPQIFITKLDVTNSKFLGSFAIEFNKQYNALIGGRGTGKSTILEYLRWGLCDQIITSSEPDEMNELEKRRKKLIDKTLTDFEGEVRITFTLNGVYHIIKRSSVTKETSLKIDDGEFQRVTEDDIRSILPIQAYSQKQLSSVGVSNEELKRFIQTPISGALSGLDYNLAEIVQFTRTEYLNVIRKKELESEIEQFQLEINSSSTQVANIRLALGGISAEEQAIISKKTVNDAEFNAIAIMNSEMNTVRNKINELETALERYPQQLGIGVEFENSELISAINLAKDAKVNEVKGLISQLKLLFSTENTASYRQLIDQWNETNRLYNEQYEIAKSRTTSNQQQLTELERIETRLGVLNGHINERTVKLSEIGNPEERFEAFRIRYWDLHREKSSLLANEANKFSALSKGFIKVEVEKKIDASLIKSELIKSFLGTRISQEKIQAIVDGISTAEDPLQEWAIILTELKPLAEIKTIEDSVSSNLPSTTKLTEYGLNENNLRKISEILTSDHWLALATMSIDFSPDFKYSTNSEMEDVIPFSEASAGQQATALLTVLLNQPGTPLLIDQPEDDIDNRAIDDIIKNIWDAKKHRQLIFTSHNANLVVNGDAELVVCCDYRDTGSQTRGKIKAEGAIDTKRVKDEITSVMEGGEKAFKLRKDKYGY